MSEAYLNRIATAVPAVRRSPLLSRFRRLAARRRQQAALAVPADGRARRHRAPVLLLRTGLRSGRAGPTRRACSAAGPSRAPASAWRCMRPWPAHWPLRRSNGCSGADERAAVSHLIVTSCTGFSAPGSTSTSSPGRPAGNVERTIVGFMGCYAAITAMKLARHIVRSDPDGAGADRQCRALHPASEGNRRSRAADRPSAYGATAPPPLWSALRRTASGSTASLPWWRPRPRA